MEFPSPRPTPPSLAEWLELQDQMRAAEVLLEHVQIAPHDLAAYWALSADLLVMLQDMEEYLETYRRSGPGPDDEEAARFLAMRRRVVTLFARAQDVGIEPEIEDDEQ